MLGGGAPAPAPAPAGVPPAGMGGGLMDVMGDVMGGAPPANPCFQAYSKNGLTIQFTCTKDANPSVTIVDAAFSNAQGSPMTGFSSGGGAQVHEAADEPRLERYGAAHELGRGHAAVQAGQLDARPEAAPREAQDRLHLQRPAHDRDGAGRQLPRRLLRRARGRAAPCKARRALQSPLAAGPRRWGVAVGCDHESAEQGAWVTTYIMAGAMRRVRAACIASLSVRREPACRD